MKYKQLAKWYWNAKTGHNYLIPKVSYCCDMITKRQTALPR